LVVAESPGETEDERGTQLIGKSGQLLRRSLRKCGLDLDADCWKTNALICCPKGETPTDKRVLACRPNLLKTIKKLNPETIILLGAVAVKSLIGHLWKESVGPIGRWVGWRIPSVELNAWVCPTWHPAYLLRDDSKALSLHFDRHLAAAAELDGRPWPDGALDYRDDVTVITGPSEAASVIRSVFAEDAAVAVDFETTGLKPEPKWAEIVSCALSWGRRNTISFPWCGLARDVVGELLKSRAPKIAHNMKFEERWTRAEFGHGVRNWKWDSMQAAHVLDNRWGVTSLGFQAFTRLGVGAYDEHLKPYLSAVGPGKPNRVREVGLTELLLYGGMDAVLTYELAQLQMKELKR